MRLSRLTLNGFKSFADRTEFVFDDDVIGVVGPNGCGKSNIVDAIKWVLGERSSKSLRGEEMMDVIFAGSAGRKPSGMAAVTLTFENPVVDESAEMVELDFGSSSEVDPLLAAEAAPDGDAAHANGTANGHARRAKRNRRGLPIDSDVVEVERRLYRDGTSQYLINGRRVRMRDIRDLFLDTGIGADSYSIIEQGKVDAMLLASPKDLRSVFEEAAGIARYKQRRVEAARKLEKTESNLLVTREQLQNTERRLRMVKGQAAKARRYLDLESERRAWQMAFAFQQYDRLRRRLEEVCERLASASEERTCAESRLAECEARKQEAEIVRQEALASIRRLEHERARAEHESQSAMQRLELCERAREEAARQLESDRRRLTDLDARLAAQMREASEAEQRAGDLERLLGESERSLEEAASARADVLGRQAERRAKIDELRATAGHIARERAALTAAQEAEQRRVESMLDQLSRLESRLESGRSERERLAGLIESQRARVEQLAASVERAEAELVFLDRGAEALSADQRNAGERLGELEQAYLRLDSRRQTLSEMIEHRVGLGEATQDVLKRRDEARQRGEGSPFSRVLAPLVDLIDTDPAHAAAVEAALGPAIRALIVRSTGDVPPEHDLGTLRGRVTFLPLLGDRAAPIRVDPDLLRSGRLIPLRSVIRESEAAAGILSGVHEGPRLLEGLLDSLFGSSLVVENLETALMVRVALGNGVRLITRSGTVVEPDGHVVAGPPTIDDGAGLVEHRSELHAMAPRLTELGESLRAARERLASLDAEASRFGERQSACRSRVAALQRELVGERSTLERLEADLERVERELKGLDEERSPLRSRIDELGSQHRSLGERIGRLGRLHEEQAAAIAEAEAELVRTTADLEQATERAASARVEVGRLAEQLASARRDLSRLSSLCADCERERLGVEQHVARSKDRVEAQSRAIAEASREIETCCARMESLQEAIAARAAELHAFEAAVTAAASEVADARDASNRAERDWNEAEMSRRELVVKLESLEDRARHEVGIELIADLSEYREAAASGLPPIDEREAAASIEAIRDAIRKLGNVNIDAIEEESTLEQRNEELIRQVADLDEARAQLGDLIERLNVASRERFGEMFERIREHFAGKDGMFRKLFGGGKAEVKLLPLVKEIDGQKVETEEIDLLESGIEIFAKPPGKEPQTIRQLSGGEKTLTVVALLLAIFKTRPSCFCVLDEVDAALDDANVKRYNDVVREFTAHSHFIVITHNKRTMQMVDRLYGVTMQERGVSTRVSVRFDQVGSGGEIKPESRPLREGLASMREADPAAV